MFRFLSAIVLGMILVLLGMTLMSTSAQAQTVYQVGTSFTLASKSSVVYATNVGAKEAVLDKGTYTCNFVPNQTSPSIVSTCTVYSTHLVNVTQSKTMTLAYPTKVSFGVGQTWVTKELPRGSYVCNTATFGSDPASGLTKSCKEVFSFIPCEPSQFGGAGSKGLFDRDASGNCLAAWYCPNREMPVVLAATAAKCNVTTARTIFGKLLTNPSRTSLEEALAQNGMTMNVFTDPVLKAIWIPYVEKIVALQSTLPK